MEKVENIFCKEKQKNHRTQTKEILEELKKFNDADSILS